MDARSVRLLTQPVTCSHSTAAEAGMIAELLRTGGAFARSARQYGSTAVRQYGSTAVRQYGSTAVRQYGSTASAASARRRRGSLTRDAGRPSPISAQRPSATGPQGQGSMRR
ncbi:hypothetical protein [Sinosporangium album]|uniref:hypothetical protein n=1 Tax=Sinosporangium album TaxID=504805 RepID=UPI0015A0CB80|nr:hypothetical protein [Sinosporangium album]